MANTRITDLPELTEYNSTNLVEVVDVTDTTDGPQGTSKKMKISVVSGDLQVITNNGATTTKSIIINEEDLSRGIIYDKTQITALSDNANKSSALRFEEPTGITGNGGYLLRDPIEDEKVIAFVEEIPIVNEHYKGTYTTLVALQTAYPTANAGDTAQVDGGIGVDTMLYLWDDDDNDWVESHSTGPNNTDMLPEGTTNLYFSTSRVLATILSGISFVVGTAVTAADTVLEGIGKLQKQITDLTTSLSNKRYAFIRMAGANFTVADAQAYFFSASNNSTPTTVTQKYIKSPITCTNVDFSLWIYVAGTLGSAEDVTIRLRNVTTGTTLNLTTTGRMNAVSFEVAGTGAFVATQGDRLEVELVAQTYGTNPTSVNIGVDLSFRN